MSKFMDEVQGFLDQIGERVAFLDDCHEALSEDKARALDELRVGMLLANICVTLETLANRLEAYLVDGLDLGAGESIPRVAGEWVRPASMVEYNVHSMDMPRWPEEECDDS